MRDFLGFRAQGGEAIATDTISQSLANPFLMIKNTISKFVDSMFFDKFLIICSQLSLLSFFDLTVVLFLFLTDNCFSMIILSLFA